MARTRNAPEKTPPAARPIRPFERILWPVLSTIVLLGIWQAAVKLSGTDVFPGPLAVVAGLRELAEKGLLWSYISDSLLRVGAGYGLALAIGIPLGAFLGWNEAAAAAANPLIQLLRPISPLAWIPVAIVLFGVGNVATIFLIFLASLFPVLVATMNGVRNISATHLSAGRNFGLSPLALFARVIFPGALPNVLTGLRIALGVAWVVVVAAEMIAVNSGLGYLVIDARNAGKRYDLVVAAMLLIGIIGLALNVMMLRLERLRALRWGFRTE
jgi:NitT/TauT family transport system permease protein